MYFPLNRDGHLRVFLDPGTRSMTTPGTRVPVLLFTFFNSPVPAADPDGILEREAFFKDMKQHYYSNGGLSVN